MVIIQQYFWIFNYYFNIFSFLFFYTENTCLLLTFNNRFAVIKNHPKPLWSLHIFSSKCPKHMEESAAHGIGLRIRIYWSKMYILSRLCQYIPAFFHFYESDVGDNEKDCRRCGSLKISITLLYRSKVYTCFRNSNGKVWKNC